MWPSLRGLIDLPHLAVYGALALIIVVAPLASALLARRAKADAAAKHARYARTMLILWSLTALALYALRLHGQGPQDVGLVPPAQPLRAYLITAFVIGVLTFASLSRTTINADYAQRIRRVVPTAPSDWAWFVPVALSAGFCEEFLYRGYALNVIASLTGNLWAGVVVSTAAFGLAHAYQGRAGVVGTTLFGLLFALIVVMSGSLWPVIAGHAAQDLLGGAILARRLASAPGPSPQS